MTAPSPARPRSTSRSLSIAQARRIAIAAQALDGSRRSSADRPVTLRDVASTVDRVGLLQIDSVNILARAHLMPLFSRLGPYDSALLGRAAGVPPRRFMEAWAHVASFIPITTYPLLGWRRRWFRDRWAADPDAWVHAHASELDEARAIVRDQGPVTARQVHALFESRHPRAGTGWWDWSVAKEALERLFFVGEVAIARRTSTFEREYDLTERVLPRRVLAAPEPAEPDAVRALVEIGARAHGIGSEGCIADYFRLRHDATRRALDELTEAGVVEFVAVEGIARPFYLHRDARLPRWARGRALLSPFDPLVWERDRLLDLFGMDYRIEIYTPEPKRVYGYYVLPFLLRDALVARVDLKADRTAGILRVMTAWRQPGAPPDTADELAAELRTMATWLALDAIEVTAPHRGDLAAELALALARV
ncbi:MAG: crosslink repair DNA glycosylase YcaQ family protein [Chloroflexota bacterium]